jgi:hypothetical protein
MPAYGPNLGPVTQQLITSKVAGPATALIVVASLALLLIVLNVILTIAMGIGNFAGGPPVNEAERAVQMIGAVVGAVIGFGIYGTVLAGALKMRKLESYGLAMTASILAMLPCSGCCLLGLPFGIWALVVLSDPYVKSAFR